MPFGRFSGCADFARVLALRSLSPDSVQYLLRQHALECDCGCEKELAHRAKLHRNYVGGIERGERNPSLTNILRLADALNVRPSQLLAEMEDLPSSTPTRQ